MITNDIRSVKTVLIIDFSICRLNYRNHMYNGEDGRGLSHSDMQNRKHSILNGNPDENPNLDAWIHVNPTIV